MKKTPMTSTELVQWLNENGGFVVKASTFVVDFMSNINGEDVEVLGNIVDNPELLG